MRARELDMIENHIGAEAALLLARIVEAVHHGDAVAEAIAQRHRDEGRRAVAARIGLYPVFGDEGLDHAVLDHERVVEHGHLGHAAVGVARVDIGAEQSILLRARRRRHAGGDEIGIGAGDAFERAPRNKLVGQDAHRHARRAGIAIGHIGDVLAAPEPALQEIVDEEARLVAGEMGEQLPLEPAGKIGTGLRRGDVEFWKVALVLCHVRPTGDESEPACRQA